MAGFGSNASSTSGITLFHIAVFQLVFSVGFEVRLLMVEAHTGRIPSLATNPEKDHRGEILPKTVLGASDSETQSWSHLTSFASIRPNFIDVSSLADRPKVYSPKKFIDTTPIQT